MTNIYELQETLQALQAMLEDADEDQREAIENTLLGMSGEVGDIVEECAKLIKNIEGDIVSIDAELDRLAARKAQRKNSIVAIRDNIKTLMVQSGKKRIKTPLFSVTLAEGRHSVQVVDESQIPDDYVIVKTVINPDKKTIGEAFKNGLPVPGCEYVRGESGVRVK